MRLAGPRLPQVALAHEQAREEKRSDFPRGPVSEPAESTSSVPDSGLVGPHPVIGRAFLVRITCGAALAPRRIIRVLEAESDLLGLPGPHLDLSGDGLWFTLAIDRRLEGVMIALAGFQR